LLIKPKKLTIILSILLKIACKTEGILPLSNI
jgi:hypothetical protein